MIDAEFKVDLSEVKGLPEEIKNGFRNGVYRAIQLVRTYVKEEAPKKTGNLSDAMLVIVDESGSTIIGRVIVNPRSADGKPYALFVAEGTGIHGPNAGRIFPASKKVMKFVAEGGDIVFARSTAGQKANPFHERGLERAEPAIPGEIMKGLDSV